MIKIEPAIYRLENKRTGELYIGGTRNAQGRKRQHEYDLRMNRHRNPKLQKAYNDGDRFSFVVLEHLAKDSTDDQIIRREQEWSELLSPALNSRNARKIFGSDIELAKERKLAGKRTTPQTTEEKNRRAASVRRYWSTHEHRVLTEEERQTISRRLFENPPRKGVVLSEEIRNKIADSNARTEYTFISPNGERITFRNMRKFCSENSLKGWVFVEKRFLGLKSDEGLPAPR